MRENMDLRRADRIWKIATRLHPSFSAGSWTR